MRIEITIKDDNYENTRVFQLDEQDAYNTDWIEVMQEYIDDKKEFTKELTDI